MKSEQYEYKILVEYISPETKGKYPHFSRVEDQEGLTKTLEDVFDHLPECVPEGWEVTSHDLTVSRNTLIVTVLLRRPISKRTRVTRDDKETGAGAQRDREWSDRQDSDHFA